MQDGLVPARVVGKPCVDFENPPVHDDDLSPFGYETFYVVSTKYPVPIAGGVWCGRHCGRQRNGGERSTESQSSTSLCEDVRKASVHYILYTVYRVVRRGCG